MRHWLDSQQEQSRKVLNMTNESTEKARVQNMMLWLVHTVKQKRTNSRGAIDAYRVFIVIHLPPQRIPEENMNTSLLIVNVPNYKEKKQSHKQNHFV